MSAHEIHTIELSLAESKRMANQGKILDRLTRNRDFKTLVLDGYFEQEAIRLVHLKAHPAMQGTEDQAEIIKQMDAIGALKGYFRTIQHQANMAEKAIVDHEEALDELRASDVEGE